jgi:hypothetical protein
MAEQDANNVNITGGTITGVTGLGDVTGPASSTDNAIARFNGTTGKLIQNSAVIIDDSNNVTGVNTLTTTNLVVNDDATLGGSNADTVAVNGRITTDLEPNADAAKDIGTSGRNWRDGFFSRNLQAEGKVVSPHFDALNSAGGQLRNSGGTPQIQWGAGGGNNVSVDVAININPANSQVDISPTGTGTVRINPATAGTINNTSIGATTPSTVNATTITGQTGVLRGTGENLQLQSQTFTNATTWQPQNSTNPTGNTTTAPDGTSTGSTFAESLTTANQAVLETTSPVVSGITYTYSIYAKANTATVLQLLGRTGPFGSNIFANFNLSNGTVGTTGASNVSATITSAGNDWYRCTLTGVATAAGTGSFAFCLTNNNASATRFPSYLGTGRTVFLWGAQFEIGLTADTYIPTTTTAVYGTPALSFSGVSSIGLLSNGALYLQPAGTGALQAQATTSTTAGGNARGANATDFQKSRVAATNVASGSFSFIGSGDSNTAAAFGSIVVGGSTNSIAGGAYTSILGGVSNATGSNGQVTTIGGGHANSAQGFFNFIGCGYANSGTAGPAVTTQSATMNGTTAVTLSGSNAAIKVGQLISGTSIGTYPHTYVAAISGTSLTLSQAASGSSTSTLSFFTPHGVVVGGGNNQATGSYSFIGGGGDAGTAANRNVASGDWSAVLGGFKNTASGFGSWVGTNNNSAGANLASGSGGVVLSGTNNTASGNSSSVLFGYGNLVSGNFSSANGVGSTNRGLNATFAFGSLNISKAGDAQTQIVTFGTQTTDATATALTSTNSAASTTNQVILPNNSAYLFKATVISNVTGGGNTSAWKLEGAIKRGANAASTTIVGLVTTTLLAQDAGAATWAIAATADTTNGGLRITFTGQASTTIRTVAKLETTEVTY